MVLAPPAAPQVNKNIKVKARVGLDGAAAAIVMRSWWQPSFTVSACLVVAATLGVVGCWW